MMPLLHPGAAGRLEDALGGGRKLGELAGRATRTHDELASAIRTLAMKHTARARFAEGAFERADASLGRLRRQIAVAALAVGAQLEHH